jgi:hypothetical protein
MVMALLIAAGMAGVYGQSPRAIVREIRGTVEVKAPGSSVWQAAAVGQELEEETVVSTGFKSTVLIAVENSFLLVKPLSRLSLRELRASSGGEQISVQLQAGRTRADIKPPAGRKTEFIMRSSIATASVRGTAFDFDTVNLRVEEGTVSFSGADNTAVYVEAGQISTPDPVSGRAATPVEIAAGQAAPAPAGVEDVAAAPPAVIPGPVPQAPVNVGIGWAD